MDGWQVTCHSRQLSPSPEKRQLSSRYLALALVGRNIPDVGGRGTPGSEGIDLPPVKGDDGVPRNPSWLGQWGLQNLLMIRLT